eukprot:TRINITY_DN1265_c0_g1_i3.p1 TRINITY_DN1265_c0_g1~~TRINITY_DN1265_c0_g1_i3.p1  ORF type:complete len:442 (-),score=46.81 TRINITY_DN1265_c0_g1_i3:34-1359(-)
MALALLAFVGLALGGPLPRCSTAGNTISCLGQPDRVFAARVVSLAVLGSRGCVLLDTSEVLCWKEEHASKLMTKGAQSVVLGATQACALVSGAVCCWTDDTGPAQVPLDAAALDLRSSPAGFCATHEFGETCWTERGRRGVVATPTSSATPSASATASLTNSISASLQTRTHTATSTSTVTRTRSLLTQTRTQTKQTRTRTITNRTRTRTSTKRTRTRTRTKRTRTRTGTKRTRTRTRTKRTQTRTRTKRSRTRTKTRRTRTRTAVSRTRTHTAVRQVVPPRRRSKNSYSTTGLAAAISFGVALAIVVGVAMTCRKQRGRVDPHVVVMQDYRFPNTISNYRDPWGRVCVVCGENPPNCVFQCGHMACSSCQAQMSECVFCTDPITYRIELPVGPGQCQNCLDGAASVAFQCGHMTCARCDTRLEQCPFCSQRIAVHIPIIF